MKKMSLALSSVSLCLAATGLLADPGNLGNAWGHCRTWDLARDYARDLAGEQPVYADECGRPVWYLYDSVDLDYDPSKYSLLDSFVTGSLYCTPGTDLMTWHSEAGTHISVNSPSDVPQICSPWAPITWDMGWSICHPTATSAAVVGWKSPVGGHVRVTARFTDFDPWGGDGVDWFVQRNDLVLASGTVFSSLPDNELQTTGWQSAVKVKKGDFLYFGVGPGPGNDPYFDSTHLEIFIEH